MADPSIISFHFSPPSQPPGSSQTLPPTCLDLYPYDSTRYAGNLSNFANFLHSTFDISWHSARARSLALHSQSYCQHVLLRYTYRFVRHTVALLVPCSTPEPIIDTRSPRFSTGDSIIPRVLRQPLLVSICSLAAHSVSPVLASRPRLHSPQRKTRCCCAREMAYGVVFQFTVIFACHFICFKRCRQSEQRHSLPCLSSPPSHHRSSARC